MISNNSLPMAEDISLAAHQLHVTRCSPNGVQQLLAHFITLKELSGQKVTRQFRASLKRLLQTHVCYVL